MSEKPKTPETLEEALAQLETAHAEAEEWKGHARTWEQRAKDNKAAADERDTLKARVTELESDKAAGLSDAEKAEKRLNDLEAALEEERNARKTDQDARVAAEKVALRARLGSEYKLPAELVDVLQGDDEEAMKAHAEKLAAVAKREEGSPLPSDLGQGGGGGGKIDPEKLTMAEYAKARKEGLI